MSKIEMIIEVVLSVLIVLVVLRIVKIIRMKRIIKKKQKQQQQKVQDLIELMHKNSKYLSCKLYGEVDGKEVDWKTYVFTNPHCTAFLHLCGAMCCECVLFPQQRWKQVKKFVPVGKQYQLVVYKKLRLVQPQTQDKKCVFLGGNNRCRIYDTGFRPKICRTFGNVQEKTAVNAAAYSCPFLNPHLYTGKIYEGLNRGILQMEFIEDSEESKKQFFLPEIGEQE